jgi:ribosomal protein S18 acetylase RimI-like enzyme
MIRSFVAGLSSFNAVWRNDLSQNNEHGQPCKVIGLRMIRWNMIDIPQVPFPEGFGARTMKLDEAEVWMDVIRDANPSDIVPPDRFEREFGGDTASVEKRCFFITDPSGVVAGTISSWYGEFLEKEFGMIHWVAVRPKYQGLGLGKAGMTYAMNRMAEWHDCCYLNTSCEKIPAVKMYLNFGFEPDLTIPESIDGWRYVKQVTNHPAFEEYDI